MISILTYAYCFVLLAASAYSQNAQLWCPVEAMNYTACAGSDVTFTCNTSTAEVQWDIFNANGAPVDTFYFDSTSNATQTNEYFTFQWIGDNSSTLTFEAQYDLDGYRVSCTDVTFTTNYTTNVTTSSNDTADCYINIPGIPSAPANVTHSLYGSYITVFWANTTNPNDCVMTFIVQAAPLNISLELVSTEVGSSATNATLPLLQGVAYNITVTATSMNDNVTSQAFCIQLSSPTAVTSLTGSYVYSESISNVHATWKPPFYPMCRRPNVTNYNVTHNVTDGNNGGSGSSGAPVAAMNDTFTLYANQTWYTFVDAVYGNVYFVEVTPSNTFGFGQSNVIFITATTTTSSSTSTPAASATPTEAPTDSGGLSAGAIAGIVIGIVAVIVVIAIITAIIIYLACCRESDDIPKTYKNGEGVKLRQGTDL